ncbi:hypothetical protein DFH28DRAFT_1131641 [Melampsora americana]|nr:hypothetical protein DFH28DRAFT_1131641 [Melampsora americana]
MTSSNGSLDLNATPPTTPASSTQGSILSPQGFLRYFRAELFARAEGTDHIDPSLQSCNSDVQGHNPRESSPDIVVMSPRAYRAERRERVKMRRHNDQLITSPRAQRELDRLAQYQRREISKKELRRIIQVIQSKRREDFRVLREALGEIFEYEGPYLQAPGQKEIAADIIRTGGLGEEFVHVFNRDAKWEWLQLRVNAP